MNYAIPVSIILTTIIVVLIYLFFSKNKIIKQLQMKYDAIESRFKDIVDIEQERNNIIQIINNLNTEKERALSENAEKLNKLNEEYVTAKELYNKIKIELNLLEETLETSTYGLYKPHYYYDTSEKYKLELDSIIEKEKTLIKNDSAVNCTTEWHVNNSIVQGRQMTKRYTKIMLRAFNGECDASILKVRWNNISVMEERINKSFQAINKLGESHSISITNDYLDYKLKELQLTYEYQEKLHEEKEEQRMIREQIRDEEKAAKEIEKARLEAEKEEDRYKKALEKAREEIVEAKGIELTKLIDRIAFLEESLLKAQEQKARAISMAQITKAGHIYIISNIGSFGEDIYKIGMTRRMEPEDRVRELSGASVPFGYDIHAMIYSENAPKLENQFHKQFGYNRLNLVNYRKEFFKANIKDLENFAHENGFNIEFTKLAEARDYRQSCQIRNFKTKEQIEKEITKNFPKSLFETENDYDEDEIGEKIL